MSGSHRLVLVAFVAMAATGASAAILLPTPVKRTLRIGVPGPLNPADLLEVNGVLEPAKVLAFPGLARMGPDGRLERLLLTELRPGGRPGTSIACFQGARFQDGEPLLPEEVVRSLQHSPASHALTSPALVRLARSARAAGDCIELDAEPQDPVLQAVLELPITKLASDGSAVGAGPYRLAARSPTVVFEALDASSTPYARIEVRGYATTDELWKRLLAAEVDLVPFISAEAYAALARYTWIRRWTFPSNRVAMLRWSPRSRLPPALRRATALAIDRLAIVERLGDGSIPLRSRRPPWEAEPADRPRARSILGYEPGGAPLAMMVLGFPRSFSEFEGVARAVESDLSRVGIGVRLVGMPPEDVGVTFGDEDAHLTLERILGPDDDEPPAEREIALYRAVIRSAAAPEVCGVTVGPQSPLGYLDRVHLCDPAP